MPAGGQGEQHVRAFCSAWEARDLDGIMEALSVDIVYQNVPRPALHGQVAMREFVAPIVRDCIRIDFDLLAIATEAGGRRVLTERIDRLHYPSGVMEIPIMGIFEIGDEGMITAWRDYPDSAHVARQMALLAEPAR